MVIQSKSRLVIGGNNCYADFNSPEFCFSQVDHGMVSTFTRSWSGPTVVLVLQASSGHARNQTLDAGTYVKSLASRPFSNGIARIIATPIIIARMVSALRGSSVAYARLPSRMGALLLLVAMIMRRPTVCSGHGLPTWVRSSRKGLVGFVQRRMSRILYGVLLRRCQIRFATEPQLFDYYGANIGPSEPLHTTLLKEVPPAAPMPRTYGPKIRLGFIGRLEADKNPLMLVEIANALVRRNIKPELIVIGDGALRTALEKFSKEADHDIKFRGWVDDRDMLLQQVRALDFVIIPSFTEGNPKVLLEAMASGVPALIRPLNSRIETLAEKGGVILVTSTDPEAWAQGIVDKWNPEIYTKLAASGRASAKEFTLPKLVSHVSEKFKQTFN